MDQEAWAEAELKKMMDERPKEERTMIKDDNQLTKSQLIGMLLLGACAWAVIIGIIYAIVAQVFSGLVIAGAGLIGSYSLVKWLIFINPTKE